jgi:type IV secretory pathway VirD2 relaxase
MAESNALDIQLRRGPQADARPPMMPRPQARRIRGKRGWRGVLVSGPRAGADSQRVIVKTTPMKAGSRRLRSYAGATRAHLRYLEREGKTVEHQPTLYTARGREQAIAEFASRTTGDPHQFRIVLSPEHGKSLDMEVFTRRFMAQMERDCGVGLDWVATTHYDTAHPHSHIVLRGRDTDGKELGLKPHYLERGMVYRAQDLATEMLGPREHVREHERDLERTRGWERMVEREVTRKQEQEHALER